MKLAFLLILVTLLVIVSDAANGRSKENNGRGNGKQGWNSDVKRRYDGLSGQDRQNLWRRKHRQERFDSRRFEDEYRQNYHQFDGSDRNDFGGGGWGSNDRQGKYDRLGRNERENLWRRRHNNDRYDENRFHQEYNQHQDWYDGASVNPINRNNNNGEWQSRLNNNDRETYRQHNNDWNRGNQRRSAQ